MKRHPSGTDFKSQYSSTLDLHRVERFWIKCPLAKCDARKAGEPVCQELTVSRFWIKAPELTRTRSGKIDSSFNVHGQSIRAGFATCAKEHFRGTRRPKVSQWEPPDFIAEMLKARRGWLLRRPDKEPCNIQCAPIRAECQSVGKWNCIREDADFSLCCYMIDIVREVVGNKE